jgi:hypothetical protein
MKQKVVTATGEPEEFSKDNSFNETRKADRGNIQRVLNYDEKLDILRHIEDGQDFDIISEEFNTTKNAIIDVYNKRDILRNVNIDRRKTLKSVVKFPTMELELLRWCNDEDKTYPINYEDIANQAEIIFKKLAIKGHFEASIKWAKGFVMRHPTLRSKQGILVASEFTVPEEIIEEDGEQIELENSEYEYLEEIVEHDPEPEYEEEYILEEDMETADEEGYLEIIPKTENDIKHRIVEERIIPDSVALKSLKTLIQYTEQKGHEQMLQQLLDYQSLWEHENF